MAWKGITNYFGWDGLSCSLTQEDRAHAALLLGHRYEGLNQPAQAVTFFTLAEQNAGDNAELKDLARASVNGFKSR